ncbi:MAG: caspase family protein, partial [Nitrospirota bacterium]|nr:caspase family protein [Nitrospirota bacterium]
MKCAPLLFRHVLGLLVAVAWLCVPARSEAEVRRALLIGINEYDSGRPAAMGTVAVSTPGRRTWKNLQGSVNDVTSMREVLIHRFGFKEADILALTDERATRVNILTAFQHHLIDPVKPGDLSILFYAGHGSRIYNSNSTELDRRDETIVPADANSTTNPKVIIDIRDKEWDRLFTQVLDRGARLTAIFDSCHSGSISRGMVPMTTQVRSLEEDERDVALLIGPEPPAHPPGQEPEKREGALIVSAAQEDQPAREAARRIGDRKEWHGAFTLALTDTLNELPTTATAQRVFDQVTAKLKAAGHNQDPELAGSLGRRRGPLFGGDVDGEARTARLN